MSKQALVAPGQARLIGIRHRVKKTATGEARPTQVVIQTNGQLVRYSLEDEQAELDFVWARYPVTYRDATAEDNLDSFLPHHLKTRELKDEENPADFPQSLLQQVGKKWFLVTKVPIAYEGCRSNDTFLMALGGSGDRLACALSTASAKVGACILRCPPENSKSFASG